MKKRLILIGIVIILIIFIFINISITEDIINRISPNNNTIKLSDLTLKQKIAQMIIIYGNKENIKISHYGIGGIFLDNQNSKKDYLGLIEKYQKNSNINLFVSTDMEGAWNPFSNFKKFPRFYEIETKEEAYKIGLEQGILMEELGFNINFAPVSEWNDLSYGGRTFNGTEKEIKEKLGAYIQGLQKNIHGTCKHYPGKGMINNLHNKEDTQNISKKDLKIFETCFKNNISSIMIGHQIVDGELNSNKKPSSISKEIISTINNSILIISDEINMKGLSNICPNKTQRYIELINAGENIILDFELTPNSFQNLLESLENSVRKGEIQEEKIDENVKKILLAKGYDVI
jgi:beta-glucosidase-like glycosyl hydrolase